MGHEQHQPGHRPLQQQRQIEGIIGVCGRCDFHSENLIQM
jgi:hypothetical protein